MAEPEFALLLETFLEQGECKLLRLRQRAGFDEVKHCVDKAAGGYALDTALRIADGATADVVGHAAGPGRGGPRPGCTGRDVCGADADPCPAAVSVCEDRWNLAHCACVPGFGPEGRCTARVRRK